jgi:predicted  nucleic acid-binding Zn-ribbon protein
MNHKKVECGQCKGEGYVRVSLDGCMKCGACQGTGFKEDKNSELSIKELKDILKEKNQQIDVRIKRLSGPSFYDQTQKIENLHGEALAYEKVIKLIENGK